MSQKKRINADEARQLTKIKKFVGLDLVREQKRNAKKSWYNYIFDRFFQIGAKLYFLYRIYPQIPSEEKKIEKNQKNILRYILQHMQDTQIGKKIGIKKFILHDDIYSHFCKQIPVYEYDDYKSWIQLSQQQENIIRPRKINRFSTSSGTTSGKKYIPVTSETMLSSQKAGTLMFAEYIKKNPDTKMFAGDFWPLTGSIQEFNPENDMVIADISALLLLERNNFENRYAFSKNLLLHKDRKQKREYFIQTLNPERILTIIGVTSRAHELLSFIQKYDPDKFASLKDNLGLIIGGGVDVAPYIKYFKDLDIDYIGVYNASEGYFGYQDIINYDNGHGQAPYKFVTNHGIFYEFIEFNSDNFDSEGKIRPGVQAKPLYKITIEDINKKYAMLITTDSGLLRYLIGDVIQFVDHHLRFKISGRTRESLNLKGEELMQGHVNEAIRILAQEDDVYIKYYSIGPDHEQNPTSHERVIEIQGHSHLNENEIIKKIDNGLQRINPDYAAKRQNDILLKLPKITIVPEGTFGNRAEKNGKLGGQYKISKISHKRNHINEILSAAKQIS